MILMMMTVDGSTKINLMPQNVYDEVAQNVLMIVTTLKGTIPYMRNFGVRQELIDQPVLAARSKLTGEIIAAVKKFEPRAKVLRVLFDSQNLSGNLFCKIIIEVDD